MNKNMLIVFGEKAKGKFLEDAMQLQVNIRMKLQGKFADKVEPYSDSVKHLGQYPYHIPFKLIGVFDENITTDAIQAELQEVFNGYEDYREFKVVNVTEL